MWRSGDRAASYVIPYCGGCVCMGNVGAAGAASSATLLPPHPRLLPLFTYNPTYHQPLGHNLRVTQITLTTMINTVTAARQGN